MRLAGAYEVSGAAHSYILMEMREPSVDDTTRGIVQPSRDRAWARSAQHHQNMGALIFT